MKNLFFISMLIGALNSNTHLYSMDQVGSKSKEKSAKPVEEREDFILEDSMVSGKDSRAEYNRNLTQKHKKKPLSPKSEKPAPKKKLVALLVDAIKELKE